MLPYLVNMLHHYLSQSLVANKVESNSKKLHSHVQVVNISMGGMYVIDTIENLAETCRISSREMSRSGLAMIDFEDSMVFDMHMQFAILHFEAPLSTKINLEYPSALCGCCSETLFMSIFPSALVSWNNRVTESIFGTKWKNLHSATHCVTKSKVHQSTKVKK